MSASMYPNVGSRFIISGVEFEVTAIQDTQIRYSTVAGGKIHHFPIIKYQNLLDNGQLTLLKDRKDSKNTCLDHLSEAEMESMKRRLNYVKEIYSYARYPTSKKEVLPIINRVSQEIDDKKPPSHATVARWFKAYISSNRDPRSLVPRTKNKGNRYFRFDPNIERIIRERIEKDYLTQQRLSAHTLYENIVANIHEEYEGNIHHIAIPAERSINRRIAKIDPYKHSRGRNGKYVANKLFKAASRGTVATRVSETIEADGNILDVLVIDNETGEVMGRPYGTCLIDKYSRCIIAFVVTMIPFSSATLLRALKVAISGNNEKFGGLFETLIVDNGSDYISSSVRNFCNHVGVRIEHGAPRDPNSKPHVERFFGTLNKQLVHSLPGTTFSNPSDKGDYKSEKYACLTLDDLNSFIEQWLDTIYHKTVHRGHGRAPEMLWKESIKDQEIIKYSIERLDTMAREVSQRRISKGRVTIHNLQWYAHALATVEQDCKNKGIPAQVDVYIDSLDLGKVFVQDPRDHTVFIQADAVFPNYAEGLSLYEHKIIRRKLKEKGKEDLASYGEYYLEIARWKLYEAIGSHSKEYSKKRIARIKETNKKNQAKIIFDKQNRKSDFSDKSKIEPLETHESGFILDNNKLHHLKEDSDQNTPDSYTFERF